MDILLRNRTNSIDKKVCNIKPLFIVYFFVFLLQILKFQKTGSAEIIIEIKFIPLAELAFFFPI